jgi:Cu-Zn family superoxide dismutase
MNSILRLTLGSAAVAACSLFSAPAALAAPAPVTCAVAVISPTAGSQVSGTVEFCAVDGGVKVIANVSGLPAGQHGFHIHEFGDISDAAKAMKTGGHYDPAGTKHHMLMTGSTMDGATGHHAGDLGNLTADESGKAHLEVTLTGVTLMGDTNPIVGRAVIIHDKPDDGGQPTGNAGGRIGQGVIGIAKP